MSLVINHNMIAMTAARNLGQIYNSLAKSTQRLSSGLRINSAADDAAGLAIREMMRADIAVMGQGIRNASDGISMIQTAEGALSVIDEKLIRMKELAEQAATGTYTTTQREIMNSEYQAMAREIDRISNATDFNGTKLLDGSLSSFHNGVGMKIHFGTGNSAAEDYYFIKIGNVLATSSNGLMIGGDAKNDIWGQGGVEGAGTPSCCGGGMTALNQAMKQSGRVFSYGYNYNLTENDDADLNTPSYMGGMWKLTSSAQSLQDLINLVNKGTQARVKIGFDMTDLSAAGFGSGQLNVCLGNNEIFQFNSAGTVNSTYISTTTKSAWAIDVDTISNYACALATAINNNSHSYWAYFNSATNANSGTVYVFKKDGGGNDTLYACDIGYGGKTTNGSAMGANMASAVTWQNMSSYTSNSAGAYFANGGLMWGSLAPVNVNGSYGLTLNGFNVGDQYDLRILNVGSGAAFDFKVTGTAESTTTNVDGLSRSNFDEIQNAAWGQWKGAEIRSQSSAQEALDAIQDAINRKDVIRANLGAYQNRLENTITNLSIMAENLQASESRISDVDVATEMTEFTKKNILAQAATSMLAQANSLPQLALSLLGGR